MAVSRLSLFYMTMIFADWDSSCFDKVGLHPEPVTVLPSLFHLICFLRRPSDIPVIKNIVSVISIYVEKKISCKVLMSYIKSLTMKQ